MDKVVPKIDGYLDAVKILKDIVRDKSYDNLIN